MFPLRITLAWLFCITSTTAAEWKAKQAPLMTRWAKDVSPTNAWPEYPRPQMERKEWLNLNGLWNYAITSKEAKQPETWDREILVPFCAESALSGVMKKVTPQDHLWYQRSVEIPVDWKGKRILLHFQAVDWETTVWVNGKELGTHRGGSDPFSFDITEALKAQAKQAIVVRVWDPTNQGSQPRGKQVLKPEGIWYTAVTGIWQTVWLEPVAETAITTLKPTPKIETSELELLVQVNNAKEGDRVVATANEQGKPVGTITGKVGEKLALKVANAKLWSPDSPHLYDLSVTLKRGEQTLDEVKSYFALRKISSGPDEDGKLRLLLNEKPLFQYGPLDQGWWPDGLLTPPSEQAMIYDLKVLKELGMNMLRKHIKVEPARYYYHCDRMGLLVWQDMPSGMKQGGKQFVQPNQKTDGIFSTEEAKQFQTELKAMLDHLYPFPSIVVWVPFNEGWGQHNTNDVLKWVMEYDPSRLVNGPSGWEDRGFGHMKDMHSYPGPSMFPVMKDRVSVLGEFGGLGLVQDGHLWQKDKNWGYRSFRSTEELRSNYRQLMVRLRPLIAEGLAAAIYTQTTDVEIEVNGLLTYDREVLKFDRKETVQWHNWLYGPKVRETVLVPTSEKEAQTWRYTTTKPSEDWFQSDFEAKDWKTGEGGFGTKGTPGSQVRTTWDTPDIWLRRTFEWKNPTGEELYLRIHHDEDAEIYINGVLAGKAVGYVSQYTVILLSEAARKTLHAGTNTIAVHCKQTGGGQYIDVGIVEWKTK